MSNSIIGMMCEVVSRHAQLAQVSISCTGGAYGRIRCIVHSICWSNMLFGVLFVNAMNLDRSAEWGSRATREGDRRIRAKLWNSRSTAIVYARDMFCWVHIHPTMKLHWVIGLPRFAPRPPQATSYGKQSVATRTVITSNKSDWMTLIRGSSRNHGSAENGQQPLWGGACRMATHSAHGVAAALCVWLESSHSARKAARCSDWLPFCDA